MSDPLNIRCFLGANQPPLTHGASMWRAPLPTRPFPTAAAGPNPGSITYGAYFEAVAAFVKSGRCRHLRQAAAAEMGHAVAFEDVTAVDISLEKHGACYHPGRLAATVAGRRLTFVVNVAVSDAGRAGLAEEVACLRRLAGMYRERHLPTVYAAGRIRTARGSWVEMFLARWFDGFHEFHLTANGGRKAIRVWDAGNAVRLMTQEQAREMFSRAAAILTAYYDIKTSEQIFNWHHAAGDFVINTQDPVAVKLITVRRYAPLFRQAAVDAAGLLQSFLIFLLKTSLHMRIDRVDGTGVLGWFGDEAVYGTVDGFLQGLALQAAAGRIPAAWVAVVAEYLKTLAEADIRYLLRSIVEGRPAHAPDRPLLQQHLDQHVAVLKHAMDRIGPLDSL